VTGRRSRPARRPGAGLPSGAPEVRDPGMARYAGECGMSKGLGAARSRKVPLCGPIRDVGARARLIVSFRPLVGGRAAAPRPGGSCRHAPAPRPPPKFPRKLRVTGWRPPRRFWWPPLAACPANSPSSPPPRPPPAASHTFLSSRNLLQYFAPKRARSSAVRAGDS
jgi:hypothetical protein